MSFIPFLDLWFSAAGLAAESQVVIGLRMFQLATGTAPHDETIRMHTEKFTVLAEAHRVAVATTLSGHPEKALGRATRVVRRHVRANRLRLTGRKGG